MKGELLTIIHECLLWNLLAYYLKDALWRNEINLRYKKINIYN